MAELVGSTLILLGAFFLFSAGIGLLRMPDAFTRMQAGTKASTLGNALVLIGLAFHHPGWTPKLILIWIARLQPLELSPRCYLNPDELDRTCLHGRSRARGFLSGDLHPVRRHRQRKARRQIRKTHADEARNP